MAAELAVMDDGGMTAPSSTAVIRQWARDNGLPVGDRGRLSPQLLTAYASRGSSKIDMHETEIVPPRQVSLRQSPTAGRILVQPRPGATGLAHKIAARPS